MNSAPQNIARSQAGSRVAAVDALRGLAVMLVFAATYGARCVYSLPRSAVVDLLRVQFRPSAWHGFTLADLCLPAFLFVAGVSLALSFDRRSRAGQPRRALVIRSLWRGLGLYAIGVTMEGVVAIWRSGTGWAGAFETANVWTASLWTGPLQQLAVCIVLGGMAATWVTRWQTRLLLCVSLLVAYGVLLAWVPFPGAEAGRYGFDHNLAVFFDGHLSPATGPFLPWDPRGITTTLPACAILVAGLVAGTFCLHNSSPIGQRQMKTIVGLSAAALLCVNASVLLTTVQPLNPHLATPPFALAAIGVLLFALAALLACDRARGASRWGLPLRVLGRHSLLAVLLLGVVLASWRPVEILRCRVPLPCRQCEKPVRWRTSARLTQPWRTSSTGGQAVAPQSTRPLVPSTPCHQSWSWGLLWNVTAWTMGASASGGRPLSATGDVEYRRTLGREDVAAVAWGLASGKRSGRGTA